MTLVLMVGWAGTTVLALVGLLGLRRTWERDRLREARLSRLEDGFAALGRHDRLAEVHQLRTRDRRHLKGLVTIPALWVAHLLRPRTAAAVAVLALGVGGMGAIQPDRERRSGTIPAYASRVFAADDPPVTDDPPTAPIAVQRPGAGTAANTSSDEAASPGIRGTTPGTAGPDPTTTSTVAATTSTTVALNLELLNGCVADVGLLGIDAELACR